MARGTFASRVNVLASEYDPLKSRMMWRVDSILVRAKSRSHGAELPQSPADTPSGDA
jgi:hypothetical protein